VTSGFHHRTAPLPRWPLTIGQRGAPLKLFCAQPQL